MQYLHVKNLHKSYADTPLFSGIDFVVEQGQKIAIVAKNGAGKSTLLDILMGLTDAPIGEVQFTTGVKVSYLAQTLPIDPTRTVIDILISHENELGSLILAYESALEDPTTNPEQLQLLLDQIESKDARSFETKVKTIIAKLQLNALLHQTIGSLSGGEKKRVGLAMALLSEPDFLILDEPTNHIDLEMIEWLEKELKSSAITLLMVSHDRYFIERICTHIYELEQGKLFIYTGGYDAYLDQKAIRLELATKQEHIMKQTVKRELERVRKAPRARGTKSVERTARYYTLAQQHQTTKQFIANATKKLDLQASTTKLGNKIFQIHSLSKKFGDKIIFDKFSYDFKAGERVGIIGKNGVGKSTFIKLLLWSESPDSGQIKKGETLVIGHYQQEDILFNSDKTVLDIVRDQAEHITIGKTTISAAKLLERFLFTPTQQHTRAYALSGGEKRRLHLLSVLIKSPNFLILDEPTNDLDLMTLHVLEEFLLSYTGCLVIISHDRFFMDRLVDHLLVFEGAWEIKDFRGTYTQWKETQKNTATKKMSATNNVAQETSPTFPKKKSLSYNEKRECEALEAEIIHLQAQQDAINIRFHTAQLSHTEIKELSLELGNVSQKLAKAEARRCELIEKT